MQVAVKEQQCSVQQWNVALEKLRDVGEEVSDWRSCADGDDDAPDTDADKSAQLEQLEANGAGLSAGEFSVAEAEVSKEVDESVGGSCPVDCVIGGP